MSVYNDWNQLPCCCPNNHNVPLSCIECPIRTIKLNCSTINNEKNQMDTGFSTRDESHSLILNKFQTSFKTTKYTLHQSTNAANAKVNSGRHMINNRTPFVIEENSTAFKNNNYEKSTEHKPLHHFNNKAYDSDIADSKDDYKIPRREWINRLYDLYYSVAGEPATTEYSSEILPPTIKIKKPKPKPKPILNRILNVKYSVSSKTKINMNARKNLNQQAKPSREVKTNQLNKPKQQPKPGKEVRPRGSILRGAGGERVSRRSSVRFIGILKERPHKKILSNEYLEVFHHKQENVTPDSENI